MACLNLESTQWVHQSAWKKLEHVSDFLFLTGPFSSWLEVCKTIGKKENVLCPVQFWKHIYSWSESCVHPHPSTHRVVLISDTTRCIFFPIETLISSFQKFLTFWKTKHFSLISKQCPHKKLLFLLPVGTALGQYLRYSKCDTFSLQVMALWRTVTQRISMPQRVQSAFNQPILQLYLTFRPLKDHEALLHTWNWGRSINCHFLIIKLTFSYMFISKLRGGFCKLLVQKKKKIEVVLFGNAASILNWSSIVNL